MYLREEVKQGQQAIRSQENELKKQRQLLALSGQQALLTAAPIQPRLTGGHSNNITYDSDDDVGEDITGAEARSGDEDEYRY
jgi:hypothetical protein